MHAKCVGLSMLRALIIMALYKFERSLRMSSVDACEGTE